MRVLITLAALTAQIALAWHDFKAHSFPESHWFVMFGLWFVIMICHKAKTR
jgi:hypothetical protein